MLFKAVCFFSCACLMSELETCHRFCYIYRYDRLYLSAMPGNDCTANTYVVRHRVMAYVIPKKDSREIKKTQNNSNINSGHTKTELHRSWSPRLPANKSITAYVRHTVGYILLSSVYIHPSLLELRTIVLTKRWQHGYGDVCVHWQPSTANAYQQSMLSSR